MNKKLQTILAAGLLTVGIAAQACTLGAWDSNASSTAIAGGPAEPAGATNFARYSGLCAMQTAGATPSVLNNGAGGATSGPAGEGAMIVRFYFKPDGNTGTIFTTYEEDAATTPVYTVAFDGTNVTVTGAGAAAVLTVPVGATNWHSVEISWANAGGAIDLWVDSDATTAAADASTTSAAAATVINAGILGGVAGVTFDAYESRRTTAIGRLLLGDANDSGGITIADAVTIVNELGGVYSIGVPDCNESGGVTIADAICVVNLL